MTFSLVDSGWDRELDQALRSNRTAVRIICPFIKLGTAKRLLKHGQPPSLQVITRYDLDGFYAGVSDVSALQLLLRHGAQIRGIRHLHAKLYLFGEQRAIVTSANLTEAALFRNHEFGFVADTPEIVARCRQYFDNLWIRGGQDLRREQTLEWQRKLMRRLIAGALATQMELLGDEGVDAGLPAQPPVSPGWPSEAGRGFVKFFGRGHDRSERSATVVAEVEGSGSHWACTYPNGRRPRQVHDGDLMFIGQLVKRPNDVIVYGRAVGMRHEPGRDDATEDEIQRRPWKRDWPHYIRVHHAEFVAGDLANGVSLNELMNQLGSHAFASTQANVAAGAGNTNPRGALMRQPAVRLSPQGLGWLNERMERAFQRHGTIPAEQLAMLDSPAVSVQSGTP